MLGTYVRFTRLALRRMSPSLLLLLSRRLAKHLAIFGLAIVFSSQTVMFLPVVGVGYLRHTEIGSGEGDGRSLGNKALRASGAVRGSP